MKYPCDKCDRFKNPDSCVETRGCFKWQVWFYHVWHKIRVKYGVDTPDED